MMNIFTSLLLIAGLVATIISATPVDLNITRHISETGDIDMASPTRRTRRTRRHRTFTLTVPTPPSATLDPIIIADIGGPPATSPSFTIPYGTSFSTSFRFASMPPSLSTLEPTLIGEIHMPTVAITTPIFTFSTQVTTDLTFPPGTPADSPFTFTISLATPTTNIFKGHVSVSRKTTSLAASNTPHPTNLAPSIKSYIRDVVNHPQIQAQTQIQTSSPHSA
ncbi:hypothetical protein D6C84_06834 [Aureobasidium pullulans]|uniref:Uncharacterized protein n=1 Tax=Aureobasidium pullulans TaxID=5580 RepID=A0A4S9XNT4_AURPU|nr:hypothetical protein D6C84_06834 [Aureobasidium pullulans]